MSKSTNERIFDIMSLIIDEINTDQLDTLTEESTKYLEKSILTTIVTLSTF